MSTNRRSENRLLDKGELELVEQTRHPGLAQIDDKELAQLIKRVRERRDRARDIARTQRRAVRGKTDAPVGEGPERGNKEKLSVLSKALQRAHKEAVRRGGAEA